MSSDSFFEKPILNSPYAYPGRHWELEAAHIRPYAAGGTHEVGNGLLLRSDLHRLFDRGYVTVTPEHRLEVSRQLRDHFSNGRSYYPLHGQTIALPGRSEHLPSSEALQWHNEHVFLT